VYQKLFIAGASIAALTTVASAADLPARQYNKAPVMAPMPVQTWTGFYIGGNGGYAWGSADTSGNSTTTTGPLFGLPPGFLGAAPGPTFTGADRSFDLDGGFGGFQVGYNYQTGAVVWGIEADYQFASIKGSDSFLASAAGPGYETDSKIKSFGTVRGRLGYSFGSVLPYVTGGYAYGKSSTTLTVQPGTFAAPLAPAFVQDSSKTLSGYTVGAGIEWALAGSWSVKAEYLYFSFDGDNYAFNFGGAGSVRSDASIDLHTVRAGLNYRF